MIMLLTSSITLIDARRGAPSRCQDDAEAFGAAADRLMIICMYTYVCIYIYIYIYIPRQDNVNHVWGFAALAQTWPAESSLCTLEVRSVYTGIIGFS